MIVLGALPHLVVLGCLWLCLVHCHTWSCLAVLLHSLGWAYWSICRPSANSMPHFTSLISELRFFPSQVWVGVLDRGPSGNSLCSNYQSRNDVGWVKIMKEKETGMQAAESISFSCGNSLCSNYHSRNDVGWVKIMKEKETGMQAAESISNSYGNSLCFCAQITSPGMTLGG